MAINQRRPVAVSGAAGKITLDCQGAVALVTLSHPGRLNALTVSMWRELRQIFTDVSADEALRCVVLRGAEGNFAAGADIREFPRERGDLASVVHYHMEIIAPALRAVASCIHPVIAQIEGVCIGGGLEVASQCDLRIAAHSSRFGVPINRLGFPMAPEEMRGLLDLAGRAVTMEILLEGRVFGAQEAFTKGLLTRIVPDADLDADIARVTGRMARGAALAARLNKRTAARLCSRPEPLSDSEIQSLFSYAESHDHHEGVRAFLAGEEPIFSGD